MKQFMKELAATALYAVLVCTLLPLIAAESMAVHPASTYALGGKQRADLFRDITDDLRNSHKLSRSSCDVSYRTPAWLQQFDDYRPVWLEAASQIRLLKNQHEAMFKEIQSNRVIRNAVKLKFIIRRLQRKNSDLYRLIESLGPNPGYLHYNKARINDYHFYKTLRRNIEPLQELSEKLWVGPDQF